MAGIEAARRPSRPLAVSLAGLGVLRALWGLLGSARFALVLIALLAFAGLLGTVLPRVPRAMRGNAAAERLWLDFQEGKYGVFTQPMWRLGLFDVFNSRWFAVLLTLLAISVAVYTANRLSTAWKDIFRPQERMPDPFFETARRRATLAVWAAGRQAVAAGLRRRRYRVKSFADGGATYLFAGRLSWAQLGTLLSHVAVLLFLVAALLSRLTGFEVDRLIPQGTSAPVFDSLSRPDQMQGFVEDG